MQGFFACTPIVRTAKGLAIDGNDSFDGGSDPLHPLEKTGLKLFWIHQAKDSPKGVMRWDTVGQLQQFSEPTFLVKLMPNNDK